MAGIAVALTWLGIPYLFLKRASGEVVEGIFYSYASLCVLLLLGLAATLQWGTRSIKRASRILLRDELPSEHDLRRAAREVARLPPLVGIANCVMVLLVSAGTAERAYEYYDVPIDTCVFAVFFGVCVSFWVSVLFAAAFRLVLIPLTRLLYRLGIKEWVGHHQLLSKKIALLCLVVALIPCALVGGVGYHFNDQVRRDEIGRSIMEHLPMAVGTAVVLHQKGASRELIEEALRGTERSVGAGTALGLAHEGRLVAATSPEVGRILELRRYRRSAGKAGHFTVHDTLDVVAHAPRAGSDYVALGLADREVLDKNFLPVLWTLIGLLAVAIALSLGLGWLTAKAIQAPLQDVVGSTTRVMKGDLTPGRPRVLADGEIGDLGVYVDRMRELLSGVAKKVVDLSHGVEESARGALGQAQEIGQGANGQAAAVAASVAAIDELGRSLKMVAESVRSLATSFRDGTVAATKIGGEFEKLAGDIEGLARGAADAARAVATFTQGVDQVAGDIQALSAATARATQRMSEVDLGLRRMREHARDAANAAHRSLETAEGGARNVRRTAQGMRRIREGSDVAARRVEELSLRISRIDEVLAAIGDIADRTNFLSINASIIAAQAGEQGKSFSVVAQEIRSLAIRTAASTREIAQTVQDVQAASAAAVRVIRDGEALVEEGVSLAGAAEISLNQIVVTAESTKTAAAAIARTTELQARNVEQVAVDTGQVASMSQRIVRVSAEQAEAGSYARQAVERIAKLNQQVHGTVAGLTDRNRGILESFNRMADHIGQVDRALAEQAQASAAMLKESERIREIAEENAARANRLEAASWELDYAADALLQEIGFFRVA
ncbi:MAG: hypothetical protein HY698_20315 [Deltaproteobacteria bacterium]|nr:hypothetical protein [Deltaproteobacteria bacterium]